MTVKTEKQMASEKIFQPDQRIVFLTTLPVKLALSEVAQRNQLSISDVIRRILTDYADNAYPGYQNIYTDKVTNLIRGEK